MLTHEFGIINNIDMNKLIYEFKNSKFNFPVKIKTYNLFHEYKPQKYGCISVDDFIVSKIKYLNFKSYVFNFKESDGFDYYYITIIPPSSLLTIINAINILEIDASWRKNANDLENKLLTAYKLNKFVIHYGI